MHDDLKIILLPLLIVFALCFPPSTQQAHAHEPTKKLAIKTSNPDQPAVPVYGYRIVNVYPHDFRAFTQGLLYHNGFFYEGTGLYGKSSLRKVVLQNGRVLKRRDLPHKYFGEGIALCGNRLFQLTYRSGIGFVYDLDLRPAGSFTYAGAGWGLTCDGGRLILSDGTATLRWLDARTFRIVREVVVRHQGRPLAHLNELEYVKGEIFANVWQTDLIARISPETGAVTGWIDLGGLSSEMGEMGTDLKSVPISGPEIDCLNGIAYDEKGDRLFVTGKLWPKLFEIKLIKK